MQEYHIGIVQAILQVWLVLLLMEAASMYQVIYMQVEETLLSGIRLMIKLYNGMVGQLL